MTLNEKMKEAGVKQSDIAKKANVSPAAVSLVSRGLSASKRITELIEEEIKKKKEKKNA
jgi:predicted transcriptional regulator